MPPCPVLPPSLPKTICRQDCAVRTARERTKPAPQESSRAQPAAKTKLKITVSVPWPVPKFGSFPQTRPYLYNVGEGLLLLSVAQGPDKLYEPYGVLRSADAGKPWAPVEGLQEFISAPFDVSSHDQI
jgi:hypothetical protein